MIFEQALRALTFPWMISAIAVIGGLETSGRSALGDVLFNNFGPGNTYQTTSGYGFGGSAPNFEQAMAFTANNNYLLTAGEFGVSLSFGQSGPFQIVVHGDEDGLPGGVIEQATVNQQLGPFGLLNPPVAVNFAGTTLLSAGERYWISMSAGAFTQAVWNVNSIGDQGPRAFRSNGGLWNLSSETAARGVFRLQGTPVPAPGALGLFGVLACASSGRRRSQAT